MAFKMKGFTAFTKNGDNKKIDGKRVKKTDTGRIEGEILGIYDNEYNEAKQDKDSKKIKQLEKRMLKLRNTVVKRGDGELFTKNKSHIDMSKFNSPLKKDNNKRRLKEVKSSIRNLRVERLKKIGEHSISQEGFQDWMKYQLPPAKYNTNLVENPTNVYRAVRNPQNASNSC